LAGYFEAHLYANIGLSIHPENMHRVSADMFSWFPLFFPLKQPLYLPSGAELDVNLWRLVDAKSGKKVWYEWCCEAFLPAASLSTGGMGSAGSNGMLSAGGGRAVSGASGMGGGQPSPMMDAPFSPLGTVPVSAGGEMGRIKIGQTSLHNPGGVHSWVGL